MSVCPLLCTHPLVYTDSCVRDGLSMTLVLVNALIFPGWRHCTDEGFRIRAYGVCEVTFGYRCRCQHAGQGECSLRLFNICWRHVHPFGVQNVWCVGFLWGHSRIWIFIFAYPKLVGLSNIALGIINMLGYLNHYTK